MLRKWNSSGDIACIDHLTINLSNALIKLKETKISKLWFTNLMQKQRQRRGKEDRSSFWRCVEIRALCRDRVGLLSISVYSIGSPDVRVGVAFSDWPRGAPRAPLRVFCLSGKPGEGRIWCWCCCRRWALRMPLLLMLFFSSVRHSRQTSRSWRWFTVRHEHYKTRYWSLKDYRIKKHDAGFIYLNQIKNLTEQKFSGFFNRSMYGSMSIDIDDNTLTINFYKRWKLMAVAVKIMNNNGFHGLTGHIPRVHGYLLSFYLFAHLSSPLAAIADGIFSPRVRLYFLFFLLLFFFFFFF